MEFEQFNFKLEPASFGAGKTSASPTLMVRKAGINCKVN
jgi:hypothetical protein